VSTYARQTAQALGVSLPSSLEEAVAALAAAPTAVPVAGGTDLMAAVNSGLLRPAGLIGLGRISEIRGWRYADGAALLGAGLTHARMGRPDFAALIPALAAAARCAGPPQIRNAGTLGGNIASSAPTGDSLPVLAALEASVILAGPDGDRELPISHLLTGMDPIRPGELLAFVRVPLLHAPQAFLKATSRTGPSRAVASVSVVLDPARRYVRCAVGAVAPVPLRPLDAERWVAALIDWDGDRTLATEACAAFGDFVALACIPDPVPGSERSRHAPADAAEPPPATGLPPAAIQLRRTVAALARRALGRALA
jgi:CO/xanthine dehydrogenase FAD-binding subunit